MSSDADPADSGSAKSAPPRQLGKYELQRHLGTGGMGAVYLAKDSQLKRMVAVKILPRDKAENPTLVKRFRAEAQAAAQLHHENIVTVYETGELDGLLFIAMEFVEGTDLHQLIGKRGRIPVSRSIEIIRQTAAALKHAHEQNIVHRDIKPSNLLIRRDGAVKLTDLGLARSVDDTLETGITRAGTTVGTVDYMAPEQARSSKAADIRSDLYSLGCTWFHMLTGHAPYPEGSLTNKLQAHATQPIPDPRSENDQVTESLVAVLRRLMAKKPEDRYQTPGEFLDDLASSALTRRSVSQGIFSDLENDGHQRSGSGRQPLTSDDTGGEIPNATFADANDDDDDAEREDQPTPSNRSSKSSSQSGKKTRGASSTTQMPDDTEPVAQEGNKKSSTKSEKGAAKRPRKRAGRRALLSEKPDEGQPTSEWLKYVGIAAGVLLLIGGLGWLVQQFSGGLSMGSATAPQNPFENAPEIQGDTVIPSNLAPTVAGGQVLPAPDGQTTSTTPPSTGQRTPNATAGTVTAANGGPNSTSPIPGVLTTEPTRAGWLEKLSRAELRGKQVTVGPGPATSTHAASLSEAMTKLPADGGTIRLLGSGVFPVTLLAITHNWVTLTGSPGERPVVLLTDAPGLPAFGVVSTAQHLELRGIHFAVSARTLATRALANQPAVTMVSADGRECAVSGCSFTLFGRTEAPVTGLKIIGEQDRARRVLIEQSTFRGATLTGLHCAGSQIDVVARQNLLLSGTVPCVELSGAQGASPAAPDPGSQPRRLEFAQSFLGSQQTLLAAGVPAGGATPQTTLVWRGVAASALGGAKATLFDASHWPEARERGPQSGRFDELTWESDDSVYLGFAPLIQLGADAGLPVDSPDFWSRTWKQSVNPAQFAALPWPTAEADQLGNAVADPFDRGQMPYREVSHPELGLPGIDAGWLTVPSGLSENRLEALASRPQAPAEVVSSVPGRPVRSVDLSREDLGAVLADPRLENGTVVDAFGSGRRTMTPVLLKNRELIVQVRAVDGARLIIEPRRLDALNPPTAMIAVDGGRLELRGGVWSSPVAMRPGCPTRVVALRDAVVLLQQLELRGPETNVDGFAGLVDVQGTTENPAKSQLWLRDAQLETTGAALSATGAGATIGVQNCLITSRGKGLWLTPQITGPVRVLSENTTWATTEGVFDLRSCPPAPANGPMVSFYVEQNVFAPPWMGNTPSPVAAGPLLMTSGLSAITTHTRWWGEDNAVADELKTAVLSGTEQQGWDRWPALWPAGDDLRALTGPGAVVLENAKFPERPSDLQPISYQLHPSSKALTAGRGGRPLGADVPRLQALLYPIAAPAAPAPGKTKTPPANDKSGRFKPGF